MWYNRTYMQVPSGVTSTPGAVNLFGRLTCRVYHKAASVLIARYGSPQASLSVSLVNHTSYEHGVSHAQSPISSDAATSGLFAFVQIAALNTSAGMPRVGTVIGVARRIATLTWSKASGCGLPVKFAVWCFPQNHLSENAAHENVSAVRRLAAHCQAKGNRARIRAAQLLVYARAAIKSSERLRTLRGENNATVRTIATCDVGGYHTLRTA